MNDFSPRTLRILSSLLAGLLAYGVQEGLSWAILIFPGTVLAGVVADLVAERWREFAAGESAGAELPDGIQAQPAAFPDDGCSD